MYVYCERMTNHSKFDFTDKEAISLYLYGINEGYHKVKMIHDYAQKHLRNYFPNFPSYSSFSHRINQVHDVFIPLVELLSTEMTSKLDAPSLTGLTDAMPIIMAQRGRRFSAKVASGIASGNGYCATKKLYYYGVKLHVVACRQEGSLPIPTCIGLTNAGAHDRKAFEQISPSLPYNMNECYADKADISQQIPNKF